MKKEDMIKAILKQVRNMHSDIITKYICDDVFKDKRPEKRVWLTNLECEFNFKLEDWEKLIILELNKSTP